jgi:hypothetical protein
MASSDAQKSEVHESTADASSSPTARGDQKATKDAAGTADDRVPHGQPIPLERPDNVRIVSDETDAGGPLVIETDDPDVVPKQTFPTERGPQDPRR